MGIEAKGSDCDVWLWDGATEYEGAIVKVEETEFAARVRQARKDPAGVLGRRVPATTIDLQRQFTGRKFLAHFRAAVEGTLFEAEIQNVQRSSDGEFDFLVAGRFAALDEAQRQALGKLATEGAAALLHQRRVG